MFTIIHESRLKIDPGRIDLEKQTKSCLVMSVSEQNLALCSDEFKNSGNSGKGFGRLGEEEDDYDEFTSTTTSSTSTTTTTSTT